MSEFKSKVSLSWLTITLTVLQAGKGISDHTGIVIHQLKREAWKNVDVFIYPLHFFIHVL